MTKQRAEQPPAYKEPRFVCPNPDCGAFAQQIWRELQRIRENDGFNPTEPLQVGEFPGRAGEPSQWLNRWDSAECGSCGEMSIWLDGRMVHPSQDRLGGSAHPDLPADVLELYKEAAEVAPRSRRAGAALARACVDRLLRHLDPDAPPSVNLEIRIKRIQDKVSADLVKLLHIVRITANGAVHVDDQPDAIVMRMLDDDEGPAILEMLLSTVNQLADELIAKPKAVDALFQQLPQRVIEKYEKQLGQDA